MTNKKRIQELFNSEDIERIAEFLRDFGPNCSRCRIKDFCDRSIVYRCKDVWQDWLTSEYEE